MLYIMFSKCKNLATYFPTERFIEKASIQQNQKIKTNMIIISNIGYILQVKQYQNH